MAMRCYDVNKWDHNHTMMGEQTTRVLKPCNATATNVILTILLIIMVKAHGSRLMAVQYLQGLCESVEASVHAVNGGHHELRDGETETERERKRPR
jgi:hypothetical protein